jgi:hypothetical protein
MAEFNTRTIVVPMGLAGGTVILLRAPTAKYGGGLTVEEVFAVNGATTSSTVGLNLNLIKLTGGTANGGTVGTFGGTAASGTASHFTAGAVKVYAPSPRITLSAGDALACEVVAVTTGTPTVNAYVGVHYGTGK